MGAVGLIAMIFGAFAFLPMLNDDIDDTEDEGIEPVDPVDPVDPATLGATFEETDDGIDIQFGENETGRLAVVTFVDTQDSEDDFLATHEARYYLVPEGVEWDDNTSETRFVIPGADEWREETDELYPVYSLDDFEDHFGLTLLGTYDLLAAGDDSPSSRDMSDSLPALTTNTDDVDHYYLEENTDGSALITFLQEGWLAVRNGAEETNVTENFVGTDDSDWITTSTQGITLDGAGGDDTLDANASDVTVLGGDGDDDINAYIGGGSIDGGAGNDTIHSANADITGGEGDDRISAFDSTISGGDGADSIDLYGGGDNNVAYGDAGDDVLSTNHGGGDVTLYGGEGDDRLAAFSAGNSLMSATLFGGDGDDLLSAGNGAIAYGEEGDDSFQANAGSTVYGGAGDDTIQVSEFYENDEGRAVVSGGDGADVFDIGIRNASGTSDDPADDVFVEISDFDVDEDMLMIGQTQSGPDVDRIVVTENTETGDTDIEVIFFPFGTSPDSVSTIVRLTGVTGLDPSTIVIN